MVFDDRVVVTVLGCNMDDVTGGWRTLYNMQRYNFQFSRIDIRIMKSSGARGGVSCGVHIMRNVCDLLT
jgi:hypothetical protein